MADSPCRKIVTSGGGANTHVNDGEDDDTPIVIDDPTAPDDADDNGAEIVPEHTSHATTDLAPLNVFSNAEPDWHRNSNETEDVAVIGGGG